MAKNEVCEWKQDALEGYWETGCGKLYEFMEGGPTENRQKYCGYCGKRIKEVGDGK